MKKIWLDHYQEGVAPEINSDEYESLAAMFFDSCRHYADRPALSNFGTSLTYADWLRRSREVAYFFQHTLGLQKADRIALMMPNIFQYPICLMAALMLGLVVVNVNPLYTPDEIEVQMQDADVKAIIVLEFFADRLAVALQKIKIQNVIITRLGDCFPLWKGSLINFVVKFFKRLVPQYEIPNALFFKQVFFQKKTAELVLPTLQPEDIAFLQYTGGTTGVPKGAVLTHRNLLANVTQAGEWLSPVVHPGQEVIVTALPLYHIFSLTANCLTFMRFGCMLLLITNPRDISGFIKELKRFPFTVFTGVNTLFNALLNHPDFAKLDFSSFRACLGGGMAVQASVAERWKKVTGIPLLQAYGLTETSPAVTMTPFNVTDFNGSIGLPLPSTEVLIRGEDGQEVPLGERGELCIKGPQVMREYWQNPSETAKVFTEDGWLRTGDIVTMDDQGYIYVVDRSKDMILVSGFNVYPNEVEHVISELPGVFEVGVVGVPDPKHGEIVKAFVVRRDDSLSEADVIAFSRRHLAAYKVPKQVAFVDELPKTNVGKILRRALK